MANHRYWRFRSSDTYVAGEYLGIVEMEMRLAAAGPDQTLGKTATASANAGGAYLPPNAINDNNGDFWTTGATVPPTGGHWLQIDFGAATPVDIVEISLKVRTDTFREDPYEIILEWSDTALAGSWTIVMQTFSSPAWVAGEVRVFNRDTAHPPQVKVAKATMQVASGRVELLRVSKATLQVVSKTPTYISVSKMTFQVVSQIPPYPTGDHRVSLM